MDCVRSSRCVVTLAFVAAALFARPCTFAANASSRELKVGSQFEAADTLNCGAESNEDAAACIAGLSWEPTTFSVELQAAQPGCGEFLVRFPSPRPIGNSVNDLVSMEWFQA